MSEVALEDLTKDELKMKLDEAGIEYDEHDKKADLIEKLEAEEPEEEGVDDDEAGEDEEAEETEEGEEEEGEEPTPEHVGPQGTDAGIAVWPSEEYPEKRPIEVDIARVDPGEPVEGEHEPPLNGESWVVLDGDHELVGEEYDGHVAGVIDYPTMVEQDPDTGAITRYMPDEGLVTVRDRGQGTTLILPLDAFKEIHRNGRPDRYA